MKTISREELKKRLQEKPPDNNDRRNGYALVNVLTAADFNSGHIPGSINIPKGEEQKFESQFDKSKEVIVYCGSFACSASTTVAEDLKNRGYSNVTEYEGGMSDWKSSGNQVEGTSQSGNAAHA